MKTKFWLLGILIMETLYLAWAIFPKLIHAAHLTIAYAVVTIFGLAWALIDVSRQNNHTSPMQIETTALRLSIALGFLLLIVFQVTTR